MNQSNRTKPNQTKRLSDDLKILPDMSLPLLLEYSVVTLTLFVYVYIHTWYDC